MQTSTTLIKRCEWAAAIFLVLAVGALSYLLLAPRLGFFGDDWYLVYAGQVGGFRKFFDVRPPTGLSAATLSAPCMSCLG